MINYRVIARQYERQADDYLDDARLADQQGRHNDAIRYRSEASRLQRSGTRAHAIANKNGEPA
jgi:hypothetical protein